MEELKEFSVLLDGKEIGKVTSRQRTEDQILQEFLDGVPMIVVWGIRRVVREGKGTISVKEASQ